MDNVEAASATYDILTFIGIGLLFLGFAMTIVEIFFPTLGLLGITGIGAMIIGAIVLHYNGGLEQIGIHWGFIILFILTGIGLTGGGGWMTLQAMKKEVAKGPLQYVGELAMVVDWDGDEGHVHIDGKNWPAFGLENLKPKDVVMISKADGDRLKVIRQ